MHDMIMSGSMAAASSPSFFTQEEARAMEAIAAARGGIDDHGFGDGTQDVDKEEEEQADLDEEDDAPELTPTSKGRKKRKKNSTPTEPRIKWTGKEEQCLAEAWKTVSMNGITGANQNYDTYWQRVKLAFDERKIVDPYFNKTVMIHGEKAMGTHWGIMQATCSRWHSIQEEIEARPVSGADFAKVCSLAVPSIEHGSPSFHFDSPAYLCRCGGRSTCTATTPTARRSSTSMSSPASRATKSGRTYAGTSPRTRTSSTTPTLQPLPRRWAAPSSARRS
jgi:hypothetical protein